MGSRLRGNGSVVVRVALAFVDALALSGTTHAQNYPAKPIRLVVPFAPGASGNIGVDFVAKSAPDGYTLIFGHVGTFGFGPSLFAKLPYDPVRDFAAMNLFAMVPNTNSIS